MSFSPADSVIFGPLFSDEEVAQFYGDQRFARYLVEVEVALARGQGRLGLIPLEAAEEIASLPGRASLDLAALRSGSERDGFPVIEMLRQLRGLLSEESAGYLHWGATTQDIMDTALVLQLRDVLGVLEPNLRWLVQSLAAIAKSHRTTLMAARTHSQQALPTTFGLKVATWLAPLLKHCQRLRELEPRLLAVQFGGAAGTLASLGLSGIEVQRALAQELDLKTPLMPWHSQRDTLAEFAGWLSLLSGSLGKMAQDVILLSQSEVAELRESSDSSRGGSSTMPQKSNPVQSELIVAAARSNATLLASMHQALIQEHERGTHGWQLEWLTLPAMVANSSSALKKASWLAENLIVDQARMKENVEVSRGLMMAEAIAFALSEHMDRAKAKELVTKAARTAVAEQRQLVEVVRENCGAPLDWQKLADETNYLGSALGIVDSLLDEAALLERERSGRQLVDEG